jgi:hypothetical protein
VDGLWTEEEANAAVAGESREERENKRVVRNEIKMDI